MRILATTARKVISRSDTGHDGELTGPEFLGADEQVEAAVSR
jgi:hypothetical protein